VVKLLKVKKTALWWLELVRNRKGVLTVNICSTNLS